MSDLYLDEYGILTRRLPNGRTAQAMALTLGRGRIALVNEFCSMTYDSLW